MRFYTRLFLYRARRLRQKFHDFHETTGSRRKAAVFLLVFIRQRMGHFIHHLRWRWRAREVSQHIALGSDPTRPYLSVKVTGGIGDYVLAARFLRDLAAQIEPFTFDIYCNNIEAAHWIFTTVPGFQGAFSEFLFEHFLPQYDVGLWLSQFIVVYQEAMRRKTLREFPKLATLVQNVLRYRPRIEMFIARHPNLDNFLARKFVYSNWTRDQCVHGMAKIRKGPDTLPLETDESVLAELGLARQPYLTIHNGFDPDMVVTGPRATKCYPHFEEVVRQIKAALPDITIIQIGTSTSTLIPGVDHDLIGRTTLRQAAALLKEAVWHIDGESGLVHMARSLDTCATVVFGPTPVDYFGYAGNINIPPATCGGCWWITETWMALCPRGLAKPACMEQAPSVIAEATIAAMRAKLATANRPPNFAAPGEVEHSLVSGLEGQDATVTNMSAWFRPEGK